MIRVILFLLTNVSVMFLFGTVLFLTGINSQSITALVILSAIVGFSGSITSLLLSKWSTLKHVRGRIITRPRNITEEWLLEVVRYQASQLGIKTPQVAVYNSKSANAFASGHSKNSALIAVSTGLFEKMDKDNIQSVIAHEFSHIVNGDMVTLALIQGVINTFVFFISTLVSNSIMQMLSRYRNSNYVRSYGFMINYVVSMVLQAFFGMLASLIVMAFSRYREFRADADAAKRIGKNHMITLLKRLKDLIEPIPSNEIRTYCIHGKSKLFCNLFASHPPVQKRIDALYDE